MLAKNAINISKTVFLVFVATLITATILKHINDNPLNLENGDCVVVTVGEVAKIARIYTVQGGGRYTVRYITTTGILETGVVKHFEITPCEEYQEDG